MSAAQEDILQTHYPDTRDEDLRVMLNKVSGVFFSGVAMVRRRARRLKLRKSKAFIKTLLRGSGRRGVAGLRPVRLESPLTGAKPLAPWPDDIRFDNARVSPFPGKIGLPPPSLPFSANGGF